MYRIISIDVLSRFEGIYQTSFFMLLECEEFKISLTPQLHFKPKAVSYLIIS